MLDQRLVEAPDGRRQLAIELVQLLDNDTTEPIPHRDNWVGEKELRDFESIVIQTLNQYLWFAEICKIASTLSTKPDIRILLCLGQINGLRRLPESERPDKNINLHIAATWKMIEDLAESSRKERLSSLWFYHSGIFARVTGNYAFAIQLQDHAASLAAAAGDEKSAAISSFCSSVEHVNYALVFAPNLLAAKLQDLETTYQQLKLALKGMTDSTSKRWLYLNAPLHILFSNFWAGVRYNSAVDYELLREFSQIDPEGSKAHISHITTGSAVHWWHTADLNRATAIAKGAAQNCFGPAIESEYLATTKLLLAMASFEQFGVEKDPQLKIEQRVTAKHYLIATSQSPGAAHQVRAVAQRMLTQHFSK